MKESQFKSLAEDHLLDKEQFRVALILEKYGLKLILKDNRTNLVELFTILEELGYINLSVYMIEDEGDQWEETEDLLDRMGYQSGKDFTEDTSDLAADIWENYYYD